MYIWMVVYVFLWKVPTSHEYKISQDDIDTDKMINCNEETDTIDDQSTRDMKHEKAEEWVKPTDSFFANAQSSAWSSKSIVCFKISIY